MANSNYKGEREYLRMLVGGAGTAYFSDTGNPHVLNFWAIHIIGDTYISWLESADNPGVNLIAAANTDSPYNFSGVKLTSGFPIITARGVKPFSKIIFETSADVALILSDE